jgi:hypothetical protein
VFVFFYEDTPIASVSSPLALPFRRGFQRYLERSRLAFHSTRVRCLRPLWPFDLRGSASFLYFLPEIRHDRVGLYFTIRRMLGTSNAGVSSLSFHPFVTRRIALLLGCAQRARFIILFTILPLDACPCQMPNIS